MRPLALDLCSGLGGWADGLEAEGWDVIRVDIADMFAETGTPKPERCLLMVQDILTFHGSQAKGCDLIVASPPCQKYSWMAMPWSLAKTEAARIRADETGEEIEKLNRLFNACFRIQREACRAAGRHIPMVVENVRGARPWVGRAAWNFGSFYLWGDVPALMPPVKRHGATEGNKRTGRTMCYPPGFANPDAVKGRTGKLHWQDDSRKVPGFRFDGSGRSFQTASVKEGLKNGGDWFDSDTPSMQRRQAHGSKARKRASAMIAKIPEPLSRHIARVYFPLNKTPPPPS